MPEVAIAYVCIQAKPCLVNQAKAAVQAIEITLGQKNDPPRAALIDRR
jgi:hypothetical protein